MKEIFFLQLFLLQLYSRIKINPTQPNDVMLNFLYIVVLIWRHVYYSIKHIGYETSICRNPPIQFYRRQKKILTDPEQTKTEACAVIMKIQEEIIFGHNILIEGVFVTQLANDEGISVWRIVWGYHKLLYHGSYIKMLHLVLLSLYCDWFRNNELATSAIGNFKPLITEGRKELRYVNV